MHFEVGETVKINDGPFLNFSGVIEEIEPDRGKLKVTVNIFGRNTPVELEYWQVEESISETGILWQRRLLGQIKLQIPAGQANPAPPVGPALGQQGVNIMAFCKEFNAATKEQAGMVIPVVITVFQDKSFTFITKSPPASILLKKAAGIASGSKVPNKDKVGKVTANRCWTSSNSR